MKRVRRWVGLAGLVTGAVLAVPGIASASATPTWADAEPVTFAAGVQNAYPYDEVTAVSCVSAGNCTAAGFFLDVNGNTQAFTQTSTNGVWATAVPAEFDAGVQNTHPNAKFLSVSCASAGNCTAAGYFKNANGGTEAFTQTSTSGTWAPAVPASFGAGVQNDPPSARYLSVSCASAGNCTAAGYFLNADYDTEAFTQTSSSGVWAQPVPASFGAGVQNASEQARFTSVSCASAGNCTGVGYFRNAIGNTEAFTQTSSSGVWAEGIRASFGVGVQSAGPNDRFLSVSCVSAGNCTAGGYFIDPNGNAEAFTQTSTAGTWAQAVPASFAAGVQISDPNSAFSQFFSVSCSSAGNCAAAGSFTNANGFNEAFTQISTSGVWAEAAPAVFPEGVQRAFPDAQLKAVSCASDGNCTAVGYFADPNFHQQAFSQTLTDGVWGSAEPSKFADGVQNSGPFAQLSAVSCTAAGVCTAGGTFEDTNYGYPAFTQTLTAEAPVAPSISSVSPTIVPLAGGTLITISGTDFDTGGVTVSIGASSCVVTNVTATAVTCRAASSLTSGLQVVTVTNTGSTLSNTLSNGVRYVDASGWITAKFPPPSADGTKLSNDLKKILDNHGNCNRDIDKLFKDLDTLVKQSKLTRTEANQAGAFFLGLCTQQTNAPAPVAPVHVVGAPVGANPPAPACSAAMNPSTFTLDFASAESPVSQFSFERSGFDTAGFWVRVDGGDWTPAVGLVPPNGSGSGIGWSSEFVQSLLHFGGVETLSAVHTYTLDVAFGTAGALDAYDAAKAACQMTLSVYVATLPETGGNTTVPLELAILFTLAGTAFIALGRRRRTA